jgi:5,10-methylenetetrahydromethanopterin reductase
LLGLNRWDTTTPDSLVADIARGETLGYTHALLGTNSLRLWDTYVLLALAARQTQSIRLAPFVDNPVMRHPATLAGSIATVDELSAGRADLVLGAGDTAVRFVGRRPATVSGLEQATELTRGLLAGQPGQPANRGAAIPEPLLHARPVPVWIAAGGPKTLQMAGRVADGVYLRVGRAAANLRAAVEAVHTGAKEVGRDPSSIRIGLVMHTIMPRGRRETAAIARSVAAGFYQYSPMLFAGAGVRWDGPPVRELSRWVWPDFHHAPDLVASGELVSFLPQAAAEAFSVFGTPKDIAGQLREAIGVVGRVDVVVPNPVPKPLPSDDFACWFAEQVWPLV